MPDETETLAPEPAVEPTIEAPEVDQTTNLQVEGVENDESNAGEPVEGTEPEIELADVEYEGKPYKLPPELKDALLRQADYTRKTQEAAAKARELDQRAEQLTQQAQVTEQELDARAELHGLTKRLAEYQQVNWRQLQQEDPMSAQEHWMEYQTMEKRAQQLGGALHQVQQQRLQTAQQETAKRLEATREYAQKNIKGWTPEIDVKVADFATKELGFTEQALAAAVNPTIYRALWLAWLGNQALQKQAAPPKPVPANVQPLETVAAKANPSARKTYAEMNMDEYAAAYQRRQSR